MDTAHSNVGGRDAATSPGLATTWGREDWSTTLIEALVLQSALLRAGATRITTDARVVHCPAPQGPSGRGMGRRAQSDPERLGDADTLVLVPRKVANVLNLSTESIEDASIDS